MFRWLSRYVKQINILGVGIELREIPAEEALPLRASKSEPRVVQPSVEQREPATPVVLRQDYVSVSGTSPSSRRTPRELELMADGEEIQFHIHQPGGSQAKLWASRQALQDAFAQWEQTGGNSGEIRVPGRTARTDAEVAFVFDESEEVEVQAGWWIWVGKQDLRTGLAEFGVIAPW